MKRVYSTSEKVEAFALILMGFVCAVAILYGYFSNILKLISMVVAHAPVDAMLIGRVVGIFVQPLGIVLGFF